VVSREPELIKFSLHGGEGGTKVECKTLWKECIKEWGNEQTLSDTRAESRKVRRLAIYDLWWLSNLTAPLGKETW